MTIILTVNTFNNFVLFIGFFYLHFGIKQQNLFELLIDDLIGFEIDKDIEKRRLVGL